MNIASIIFIAMTLFMAYIIYTVDFKPTVTSQVEKRQDDSIEIVDVSHQQPMYILQPIKGN